jgi:hypothetical protein
LRALKFLDSEAESFEETPDFTVFTFAQSHFDEAFPTGGFEDADLLGAKIFAFMEKAFFHLRRHFGRHFASNRGAVFFADSIAGVRQFEGKIAVVGVENEAFT